MQTNARILLVVISMLSCLANATANQLEQQRVTLNSIKKDFYRTNFYRTIAKGGCINVQQGACTQEQCLKIHDVNVTNFFDDGQILEIKFKKNQETEIFSGEVTMGKSGKKWVVNKFSVDGLCEQNGGAANLSQFEDHQIEVQPQFETLTSTKSWNEPTQTSGKLTFGSPAVLKHCWTEKQLEGKLKGSSRDKRVRRPIKNPYRKPPRITKPSFNPPRLEAGLQNSIRRVNPYYDKKIVALTFDLCERTKERTGYDAAIINYLRRYGIKATFYAGGKWMHSHPDKAMQLMADPLFEIGNHAWTHGNMRMLRGREMENQILWTQGQYEVLRNKLRKKCQVSRTEMARIPSIPLTFRFPYGTCSKESLQALAKYDLPAVQWDVVTGDPSRKQSAKAIADTILHNVRPGSIIIAHANGRGYNTAKALPLFIPKLRDDGYRFVTVSELLNSGEAKSTNTCYELRPGDNKKYDRFGKGTE